MSEVVKLAERLRARKIGEAVIRRITRLNPEPRQGELLRGWHPKRTARKSYDMDVCSRQVYERKFGKGSARALPAHCFINVGGRRRFITGWAFMQGPVGDSP